MTRLTDVNLSILADTDCPSDWEREDLLGFAQEASREILKLRGLMECDAKSWDDIALPEDADIDAAFPTRSGSHDEYAEAMRLVGARRSKNALVALVNWLLVRIEALEDAASERREYRDG